MAILPEYISPDATLTCNLHLDTRHRAFLLFLRKKVSRIFLTRGTFHKRQLQLKVIINYQHTMIAATSGER
jgi:hypothetical protein